MTYKATLGITSILITIGTSLLLTSIVGFALYRTIFTNHIAESIIFLFIIVGISALYLVVYIYRPIYYIVDEKQVTIKRPVNDVIIPVNEIRNAVLVKKESMKWTERVGGNGGMFGFMEILKTTLD